MTILRNNVHAKYRKDAYNYVSAAATIASLDLVTVIDSSGGTILLTLPNVTEAAGNTYSFFINLGGNAVTFQDNIADSAAGPSITGTFDGTDDRILLYCDGLAWYTLVEHIA